MFIQSTGHWQNFHPSNFIGKSLACIIGEHDRPLLLNGYVATFDTCKKMIASLAAC